MKKVFFHTVLILCLLVGCSPGEVTVPERDDVDEGRLPSVDLTGLFSFDYERQDNPDIQQLSIIQYILKNTYEVNIHQMRGETQNRVFTHDDGREAVYDKDGKLVTNSYNQGSFNFYSNETEPIKKFIYDIAPWLLSGNTREDPTTFEERLYYYSLDLDIGIQSYIFEGSDLQLEAPSFDLLSDEEKEVYYIFLKLLFNDSYEIELSSENIQQLRDDSAFYFAYFEQVEEMLGVTQ